MPPVISKEKCIVCKTCAEICPLDVLKFDKNSKDIKVRYPDECWHCRACVIDCPTNAIHMRYPLSHFMLHQEVDKAEYRSSKN